MGRLPPVEKFPLAVRKNIRDEWDNKKEDFEKQFSDLLGESWKIDININQVAAYGTEGYAKDTPGSLVARYIDGALYQLKYYLEKNGDSVKKEINTICTAHTISMDLDEDKKFSYCGAQVSASGQLVIIFTEGNLGTNVDYALSPENLEKALNEAPAPEGTAPALSFAARKAIKDDYDSEIGEIQAKLNKIFQRGIVLEPRFEDAFAKLKAASDADVGWEQTLGRYIKGYFAGLVDNLEYQKFGEDDMLREGFLEVVEKGTVVFRIVDQVKSYNECAIEDGVLYLQTVPKYFGTNISYIAEKLMDLL